MALNIIAEPVKFLLKKRLLRALDKQCSKKQQLLFDLRKSKIRDNPFLQAKNKKANISNTRNTRTGLSLRSSSLLINYKHLANSAILRAKYCTKSKKCESNSTPGRHQFHPETEEAINQQINEEFNAAFAYLSMACYFGRTEIALPGCQGFFMNMYEEELEHAAIFINFQLMRGAHVLLAPINVPESQDWKSITKVFTVAVQMEKSIKEKLNAVFLIAEKHTDLQVMDLISTDFMEEQNRSICELARLLAKAKMTDTPTGEYLFDKFIYSSFVKESKDNLMYKTKLDPKEDGIYK